MAVPRNTPLSSGLSAGSTESKTSQSRRASISEVAAHHSNPTQDQPHHAEHSHVPRTKLEWFVTLMGFLASISLGIVACIAFYVILGWGGIPFAVVVGLAAFFTEGVVYLSDMAEELTTFWEHSIDRNLKNKHIAAYLLTAEYLNYDQILSDLNKRIEQAESLHVLVEGSFKFQLAEEEAQIIKWIDFELERHNAFFVKNNVRESKFSDLTEEEAKKRIYKKILTTWIKKSYHDEKNNFTTLINKTLTEEVEGRLSTEQSAIAKSFRRERVALYIAMFFAAASGLCFGVIGFTHCTTISVLAGISAAATPWWVLLFASIIAFAAAFTYGMLMASAVDKFFNGGCERLVLALKEIFIHPNPHVTQSDKYWHIAKGIFKFLLLVGVVTSVILVGLASGGTLLEACTKIFVDIAQMSAPLVEFIATIVSWVFWVPLMLLFLLNNSWLAIKAIWKGLKQAFNECVELINKPEKRQKLRDFFANLKTRDLVKIPFYIIGGLLATFFLILHLVSEGALSGEGAAGEPDFFSNVFSNVVNFLDTKLNIIFDAVAFVVALSTIVEGLEDLPYFSDDDMHDHGSFIVHVFKEMGGVCYDFFSDRVLYKLIMLSCAGVGLELLISGMGAWVAHASFLGISAGLAPSILAFGILLLATVAVLIYLHQSSATKDKGYQPLDPADKPRDDSKAITKKENIKPTSDPLPAELLIQATRLPYFIQLSDSDKTKLLNDSIVPRNIF